MHHLLLLTLAAIAFAAAARHQPGWPVLFLAALLATLILYPVLFSSDPNPRHSGIAQSIPIFGAYTVVLLGAAYLLLLRLIAKRSRRRSIPASAFVFLGFLAIGLATVWHGNSEQIAGALQLTLGFCAWFIGGQIGPLLFARERGVRAISEIIAVIVVIETVVSSLQRLGMRINPMPPALAAIMGHRTNGTTNHPDNLGKVLFLLLVLALGLMASADRRTRRTLWMSIILLFVPLGLSQGRADILAAISTIVLWALLSGGRRPLAVRAALPLVVLLVFLPFAGSVAKRIEEDPNGGPRAGLAATAIEQIHREPWGVGPNSYVAVVSAYNAVTAIGYPVHNTFLLTAAELGIVGAILFWLPLASLLIASWLSRKRPGFRGTLSISLIASAPGLYVINATGWGILSGPLLPLWFLLCGLAYSQIGSAPTALRNSLVRASSRPTRSSRYAVVPTPSHAATMDAIRNPGQLTVG